MMIWYNIYVVKVKVTPYSFICNLCEKNSWWNNLAYILKHQIKMSYRNSEYMLDPPHDFLEFWIDGKILAVFKEKWG